MPGLGKSNEHSKSSSSRSSSSSHEGQSSRSHGGLGLGGGSFHGSSASYGGGVTAHEGFSRATGGSSRDGQSSRRVQKAIDEHKFSEVAATTDYGIKKPSKVGGLTGEGTLSDMWEGVKSLFKDDEYVTPTGAYKGYGFQAEDYEKTPMGKRSFSEQWSEDKMNAVANLAKNPMVSTAMWATGMGLVNVGVQVADTIKDMVEGDIDTTKGLGQLASTAVTSTPIGESLGQFRGIVGTALEDVEKVPSAIAGMVGGQVGTQVAGGLASALKANPYISAGIYATGAIGGAALASKYAKAAIKAAPVSDIPNVGAPRMGGQQERQSPLLIASAPTVKAPDYKSETFEASKPKKLDLPFYGTPLNQQLPMYGLAQVSPRRI